MRGLALLLLALTGCTDAVRHRDARIHDPAAGTGSSPGDPAPNVPPPLVNECAPLPESCQPWPLRPEIVAEAPEGLDIIAVRERLFIASSPPGTDPMEIVLGHVFDDHVAFSGLTLPGSARAVDARWRLGEGPTVALTCDMEECQLYAADPDTALAPMLEPTSLVADAAGVVDWLTDSGQHLCIYGQGVACHDGSVWVEQVPADGRRFLGAHRYGQLTWFVGEYGRAAVLGTDGAHEVALGSTQTLRSVSSSDLDGAAVIAGDGAFILANVGGAVERCDVGDTHFTGIHDFGHGWFKAFTSDGRVLRHADSAWTCWLLGPEQPLLVEHVQCGLSDNVWYSDGKTVWGTFDCTVG